MLRFQKKEGKRLPEKNASVSTIFYLCLNCNNTYYDVQHFNTFYKLVLTSLGSVQLKGFEKKAPKPTYPFLGKRLTFAQKYVGKLINLMKCKYLKMVETFKRPITISMLFVSVVNVCTELAMFFSFRRRVPKYTNSIPVYEYRFIECRRKKHVNVFSFRVFFSYSKKKEIEKR